MYLNKIAYEYKAVQQLKSLVVDDEVQSDEYDIYIEDLEEVISSFISGYTIPNNKKVNYFYIGEKQPIFRKARISALLSKICESTYIHSPIINNESINKNILPSVAVNSRNKLLNGLINTTLDVNLGLSGNGQDVSIMRSTLIQTGVLENNNQFAQINLTPKNDNVAYMLNVIQSFITDTTTNGEKNLGTLYDYLTLPEYGIGLKLGVIPIYLAVVFHLNRSNIVIKNGNKEVKLSVDLLNSINSKPSNFSVIIEDWNKGKAEYLTELECVFKNYIHEQEKTYNNFAYIVYAMNRWYMSLPNYAKQIKSKYMGLNANNSFRKIPKNYVSFTNSLKQIDNINPREFLFEKTMKLLEVENIGEDVINNIKDMKDIYDSAITRLVTSLIFDTKAIFTPKDCEVKGSLTSIIQDWYSTLKDTTIQHLFNNNENQVIELMGTITNDEHSFVKSLAKSITGLRVEDWKEETIHIYNQELLQFKNTVEEFNNAEVLDSNSTDSYKLITTNSDGNEIIKSFTRTDYSNRAKLLYNEITNSIDEMGQSITEQEKRQILIEILEKLC